MYTIFRVSIVFYYTLTVSNFGIEKINGLPEILSDMLYSTFAGKIYVLCKIENHVRLTTARIIQND